jgi:hypothetical protein
VTVDEARVSTSVRVIRMTGMASGWLTFTSAFGAVFGTPKGEQAATKSCFGLARPLICPVLTQ